MKKSLPLGTLVIVLILALASIGVGYGLWAKTLKIEGDVHTGVLNAVYSIEEVSESYDYNTPGLGEWEGKDVGSCVAELLDGLPNPGPQLIKVTIRNSYPSYNCFMLYDITNAGTIPIKVHLPEYSLNGIDWVPGGIGGFYDPVHVNSWPTDPTYVEDAQLHPGQSVYKWLHFHTGQEAEMDTDYTFYVRHFVHQWNEEP
jgi:hypothetical protein